MDIVVMDKDMACLACFASMWSRKLMSIATWREQSGEWTKRISSKNCRRIYEHGRSLRTADNSMPLFADISARDRE